MALYEELAQLIDFGWSRTGSLALFATKRGFIEGEHESETLGEFGIKSKVFHGQELQEVDRALSADLMGGIYYPQDAQLIPTDFVVQLAAVVQRLGVRLQTGVAVQGFRFDRSGVVSLKTTSGECRAHTIVVAAGAWSTLLSHQLSLTLPIEAGKGYGFTIDSSSFAPRTPLLLSEARIAVTPMQGKVRFTGGLDLCGLDTSLNADRLGTVFADTQRYFGYIPKERIQVWCGLRPCTPDGLPIIARHAGQKNIIVATGHGMLGMTLGPITGKLVLDLVRSNKLEAEIPELSFERFQ